MAKGARKNLSSHVRLAMKKIGKFSHDTKTPQVYAGESPEIEVTGIRLIDELKHLCAPSNTELDFRETALAGRVSSSFYVSCRNSHLHAERNDHEGSLKNALEALDFLPRKHPSLPKPKQMSRGRMQTNSFKNKQSGIVKKLLKGCVRMLGTETMLEVLYKMGNEAGEKEYNAMTKLCIERAWKSNDVEYALEQIGKAIEHLKQMRQLRFSIEEGTYGLFLEYLIDMEMVEDFQILKNFIKKASPESTENLIYYEMLLWIQVNNEEKINELFNAIDNNGISLSILQEYYLVALCEKDSNEKFQKLLAIVDITKVSSPNALKSIFSYLGKSLMESTAMKLLWQLRDCGKDGVETVSNLIFSYATCIPNSTVEGSILKINKLHEELDIVPSSTSYEKLVSYLCGLKEVVTALDVVESMCDADLQISANIVHSLLHAIENILEFNLVQRFNSIMKNKKVKPNRETFRRSINLCIKIKDFEGAYNMLGSLKNFNLAPDSSMYNSILAGYFREKKVNSALMVLKEMKEADVQPDSVTFSHLINYCDEEEAIAEYYEKMKQAGLQANKHVYMSLIRAYASCGQFEKSRGVLMDLEIPAQDHNELKSVLISALASNGKITDALSIYDEMKKANCRVEPKAIISLIDHSDSNEELTTLVQLTDELRDYKCWIDGFFKTIVFAVRNNKSSSILDLLEQTKNHLLKDDNAVEYWFEEMFRAIAETEPSDVKLGLELVSFMKEELELCPSRKCLDFLLQACVNAKDKQNALLVWTEYQCAELPYNVLNYLRMYQVLLAARDLKSAQAMVSRIPSDDKDVKHIMQESRAVFTPKMKKKKSKKIQLPLQVLG